MKKMINREDIQGYLYDMDLSIKQVSNEKSPNFGKDYIRGTLHIATDHEGLNVVPVTFTYVSPTTSSGTANRTYEALQTLFEADKTWVNDGKENAPIVSCSPSLALNEFYTGDGELVSQECNNGGFVTIKTAPCLMSAKSTG